MSPRAIKVSAYLYPEEHAKLERLALEDGLDRSRMIAKLIEAEWLRRYGMPNPGVRVSEALEAADSLHAYSIAEEAA